MSVGFNQWKNQFLDNSTLSHEDKDQLNGDYSSKLQQLFDANFQISPDKVVFGSSCECWPLLISPKGKNISCLAIGSKGGMGYSPIKVQEYIDREINLFNTPPKPRPQPVAPVAPVAPVVQPIAEPEPGSEPEPSDEMTLADVFSRFSNLFPGGMALCSGSEYGLLDFQNMGYFTNAHPEQKNNLSVDELLDCQVMFLDKERFLIKKEYGGVIASSDGIDILPVHSSIESGLCHYLHGDELHDEPFLEEVCFRTFLRNRDHIEEMLPYLNSIPPYSS